MFIPDRPHTDLLLRILILGPVTLLWVTVVVRFIGLRAFSKMAAFDFVATVATGSLLASAATAVEWSTFLQASLSIAAILLTQMVVAWLRRRTTLAKSVLENQPRLLVRDGVFDRDAMNQTRVTDGDIRAKLREANVLDLREVRAVVLETTGDISVLHGDRLDRNLLEGVKTADRFHREA